MEKEAPMGVRTVDDREREWVGGPPGNTREGKKDWVLEIKIEDRHLAQARQGTQAGEIVGLLDHLFAEHWEVHCAELRKLAHEAGQEQLAVQLLAVNIQRSAPMPSYVPHFRPPAGRGRGFTGGRGARRELVKGGFDLTHYPNAKPEPPLCCRGWWLDGLCNATGGVDACRFQHANEHKGQGFPASSSAR